MTDDKRPREWFIKNSFQEDHANIHGPKTKGCKVIEKSAYDALAKENETLKQTLKHDVDKIEAGYASERDTLKAKLAEVERWREKWADRAHICHEELTRERELSAKLKAHAEKLAEALESAASELSAYSQGERDKSFDGWQLTWREVPIKHESDYAFYPNHVTKEAVADLRQPIAEYRKEFKK